MSELTYATSREWVAAPKPEQPQPIPTQELVAQASRDFQSIDIFSQEQLAKFVENNVRGVKVGNTNVLIVSHEHTENHRSPIIHAFASHKRTKANVVEYFWSEVADNFQTLPVASKVASNFLNRRRNDRRFTFSDNISEISKQQQTPLIVTDIANSPFFELNRGLAPVTLLSLPKPLDTVGKVYTTMWMFNAYHKNRDKIHAKFGGKPKKPGSFFDVDTIHEYERVLLDVEDARRVYIARGLTQLAQEYSKPGEQPSQIMVYYPQAHAKRIYDYMTNTDSLAQLSQQAKEIIYKAYPFLGNTVRQYKWAPGLKNPEEGTWLRFSSRDTTNPLNLPIRRRIEDVL